MKPATILVVEDETIVAKDIQFSLQRLGYHVPSTATSGEEAIRKAGEIKPDLVIMDIVLKGQMDGVETAHHLQHQFDLPVVYLTAYADNQTLDRVKTTTPAGYMLKPFQPNELRTTVELALHRSRSNRHVKESLRWLMTTIRCIEEAVITTDREGQVTYLSPAAEALTGWQLQELMELDLAVLLQRMKGSPLTAVDNPARRAIRERRIIGLEGMYLKKKNGALDEISGRAAPVVNEAGTVLGAVAVFHSTKSEDVFNVATRDSDHTCGRPAGIINLCAWCKRVPDQAGHWYDLATFISEHSAIQFNGGLCPECMVKCFPQASPDTEPHVEHTSDLRSSQDSDGDRTEGQTTFG
jgi:PAS domain S-box-containing protein